MVRGSTRITAVVLLCVGGLCIGGPARPAWAQAASGSVTGVVRDSLGSAVGGAEVFVDGGGARAVTTSAGTFTLAEVPAGRPRITVRRLGFLPSSSVVEVQAAATARLDFVIAVVPRMLSAVDVVARHEPYDARLTGFNARVGHATGGHFLTRAQIEANPNARLVDALRRMPGVRVTNFELGRSVLLGGARCTPTVYVDGFAATAGQFDLDMVDLGSVEGVEVYSGSTTAPPELLAIPGHEQCGVVAIWSRPTRPRQRVAHAPVDIAKLIAAKVVLTDEQVDERASYVPGSAAPVYPADLLQAGRAGRSLLEFVVDTAGAVEPGTIEVVSTTDPEFGEAARSAVIQAIFTPARIGKKRVRQVVDMPFQFDPKAVPPARDD